MSEIMDFPFCSIKEKDDLTTPFGLLAGAYHTSGEEEEVAGTLQLPSDPLSEISSDHHPSRSCTAETSSIPRPYQEASWQVISCQGAEEAEEEVQAVTVNLLPQDLICRILCRLNPKTLGRLKSVCRQFHDLINSPHFVLHMQFRFSRRDRPYVISRPEEYEARVLFRVRYYRPELHIDRLRDIGYVTSPDFPYYHHPVLRIDRMGSYDITLSLDYPSTANGLLLCAHRWVRNDADCNELPVSFRVLNPATRQKMDLPTIFLYHMDHMRICQLLWDSSSGGSWGTYKVLVIYEVYGQGRPAVDEIRTLVFTIGEDTSWRNISGPKEWRITDALSETWFPCKADTHGMEPHYSGQYL